MRKRVLGVLIPILLFGCSSPESPKIVAFPTIQRTALEKKTTESNNKVDILFVIDNSGSMGTYQMNLAENISQFVTKFFDSATIDYHIGVISTDADMYSGTISGTTCCGQLQGTPAFIDKSTPNAQELLSQRMLLGTNGSATEKSFEPVKMALSERVGSTINEGFYRSDAYLAVIFITDAEDQSNGTPEEFYNFLAELKKDKNNRFHPEKILSFAAIIPSAFPATNECSRDTGAPLRIEQFIKMTASTVNDGERVYNLCDPDFGEKLAGVAQIITDAVDKAIYLNLPPIVDTIKVTYGTQVIPPDAVNGWSFDAKLNAIVLGKNFIFDQSQPADTKIRVDFDPTTYNEANL